VEQDKGHPIKDPRNSSDQSPVEAFTHDVSNRGARCYTSEPFEVGALLRLEIELSGPAKSSASRASSNATAGEGGGCLRDRRRIQAHQHGDGLSLMRGLHAPRLPPQRASRIDLSRSLTVLIRPVIATVIL